MPLWVGDYRADTTGLNAEEHGAYLLLIMHYWTNGPPPDDDKRLSRIAVSTMTRWKKLRPILSPFFKISRGVWRHDRIEVEIARAERFSERAKAGANARWNKELHATASDKHMLNGCTPQPHPQREVSKKEAINEKIGGVGSALRARGASRVDFSDPVNRYAFACKKIATGLSERMSALEAQTIIMDADSGNAKALEICRAEARKQRVTYKKPVIPMRREA